jgi:hypothetical protein
MTRNFLFTLFFIFSAFSFFAQGTTVYSPQLINNTAPFPGESCASEYAENEFLKDPAMLKQEQISKLKYNNTFNKILVQEPQELFIQSQLFFT